MSTAPPGDDPADQERTPPKTRLDREVDEILARSDKIRPFPTPGNRESSRKPPVTTVSTSPTDSLLTPAIDLIRRLPPLVIAIALGIAAWVVSDVSQLLANLFAFAAIVALLFPLFSRLRGGPTPPRTQMWRGREMDVSSPGSDPLRRIESWWKRRR